MAEFVSVIYGLGLAAILTKTDIDQNSYCTHGKHILFHGV